MLSSICSESFLGFCVCKVSSKIVSKPFIMLATPSKGGRMTSLLRTTTPLSFFATMLWLFLPTSARCVDVSYSELQRLGVDCFPRDTCSQLRTEDTLDNANCHCGPQCVTLDTCCVDSRYRGAWRKPHVVPACVQVPQNNPCFMVDRCKPGWKGEDYVKAMCRGDEAMSDPMLVIPVTSSNTHMTYKNVFCATCNGERRHVFWNVSITRYNVELPPEALQTLKFDGYSWVIQDGGGETDTVEFRLLPPRGYERDIRSCRPGVISECASGWSDDVTRRKCAAYMAVVMVNYEPYRNAHCAICNFEVNVTQRACVRFAGFGGAAGGGRRPLSFALLLDVNLSDGEEVGLVDRCGGRENAVYDPFFKRCRRLSCALPGHTIKDGKCVQN